ncbi:MAG: hypothetical protein JO249_10185 [Acidobacteria bacterium]|nr:hypothetical protein [Acidobacteriota bacterium]
MIPEQKVAGALAEMVLGHQEPYWITFSVSDLDQARKTRFMDIARSRQYT